MKIYNPTVTGSITVSTTSIVSGSLAVSGSATLNNIPLVDIYTSIAFATAL